MEVSELIQDAELVASFGLRAGLLKRNDFFEALQKAHEKGSGLTWSSPEIVGLQSALNTAISDIAPVTLLDLRGNFNPFEKRQKPREGTWLQVVLIVFAFVLVFLGAHFSIWQEKATTVLREIAENKQDQQKDLVADLIPLVMQFQTGTVASELEDAVSLSRGSFREKVDEARRLAQEIVNDTATQGKLNDEFYLSLLAYLWKNDAYSANANAGAASRPSATPPAAAQASTAPNLLDYSIYAACFPPNFAQGAIATADLGGVAGQSNGSFRLLSNLVDSDDTLIQGIRCLIGLQRIERQLTRNDYEAVDAKVVVKLKILVLWILPAIYGMLGAVIFHLRICMNPMRPDPQAIRVVLRVFLSGFAGVAMCWFWRPNSAGDFEFGGVAIGALAAAFLVGYGIDIFFNLLDRLVTLANKATQTVGAAKAET